MAFVRGGARGGGAPRRALDGDPLGNEVFPDHVEEILGVEEEHADDLRSLLERVR